MRTKPKLKQRQGQRQNNPKQVRPEKKRKRKV